MELSDLRTFEVVARLGGINRAATELNTVQSNVTSRIRALERELGAELFRRHSRASNSPGQGADPAPRRDRVQRPARVHVVAAASVAIGLPGCRGMTPQDIVLAHAPAS